MAWWRIYLSISATNDAVKSVIKGKTMFNSNENIHINYVNVISEINDISNQSENINLNDIFYHHVSNVKGLEEIINQYKTLKQLLIIYNGIIMKDIKDIKADIIAVNKRDKALANDLLS